VTCRNQCRNNFVPSWFSAAQPSGPKRLEGFLFLSQILQLSGKVSFWSKIRLAVEIDDDFAIRMTGRVTKVGEGIMAGEMFSDPIVA
jgi:hypothetical protein